MKRFFLKIWLVILAILILFFIFASILMLSLQEIPKSERICSGVVFAILAIFFIIPFIILLKKLRKIPIVKRKTKRASQCSKTMNPQTFTQVIPMQSQEPFVSLSDLLLMKIDSLSTSGVYFEKVACVLFQANGFHNVRNTQASKDYGVDILAEKDGISYAIQCKCYSSPVGNKAVQEVYSGKDLYRCIAAAVLTNSTFTKNAVETALANGVILWDRTMLIEMIKSLGMKELESLINL